jgi:hypothetical protein
VGNGKLIVALMLLAMIAAGTATGVALLTAPKLPDEQHSTPVVAQPDTADRRSRERERPTIRQRPPTTAPDDRAGNAEGGQRDAPSWIERRSLVELVGLAAAAGTLAGFVVAVVVVIRVVRRRTRNRRIRAYARYVVHLSAHDEAARADLDEAIAAMIGIVRERADVRWRQGQPWFAIELHYSPGTADMEWMICFVCEPRVVRRLDAALASAYPDVRVGYEFVCEPTPLAGRVRRPAHIERLLKRRSFVFALGEDEDRRAKGGIPLIELVAQAQTATSHASTVRLTLLPTLRVVEQMAGWIAHREADSSAREETWSARSAGLRSPQRRRELEGVERTQHRSLCWFELVVGSDDRETCEAVAATVQALPGANRLRRRIVDLRPRRTRERFVSGEPPLLPWPPMRSVLSSAEIATIIELPTARMRGVPVRRLMLPRIPAPPEALRAAGAFDEPPEDHVPFDPTAIQPRSGHTAQPSPSEEPTR